MATHTFAPTRHLQFGLPIQEWDNSGFGRTLIDFKAHVKVDAKLFTLPKGFVHYTSDKLPQL